MQPHPHPQVMNAILSSLSHENMEIKETAMRADSTLLTLLQASPDGLFEMHTLLHTLAAHLASQHGGTLLAALAWVHMLLRKSAV